MNSPTEQSENTPQIAQILQFLQDPMEVPQLYLSYCGEAQTPQYDHEYQPPFHHKEYTTVNNTPYDDPAYHPENGSDGSELEDDASVMFDYPITQGGQVFCQNCAYGQYHGCSCYTNSSLVVPPYDPPSNTDPEEDSNDSIEKKLPSIDIFKRDTRDIISSTDSHIHETGKRKRGAKNILLWKFLLAELSAPNPVSIKWVNKSEGTFRFMDTVEVSRRWGQKKQKADMNFEKLSRGIRHYYKNKFMTRIDGVRLVYKFNWSKIPKEWRPFGV